MVQIVLESVLINIHIILQSILDLFIIVYPLSVKYGILRRWKMPELYGN